MDENDINNPANCFVEELKEANPNNISVPICGAKILEDNEKIAQDLSNRDKSADIFFKASIWLGDSCNISGMGNICNNIFYNTVKSL